MMRPLLLIAATLLGLCSLMPAGAAEPVTVLVTGANRGIGLEYARQFAAKGYRVIGTARDVSAVDELTATGAQVEALDVTDAASVAALAKRLDGVAIDILVNNAGMFDRSDSSLDKVDFAMMEQTFAVNTFGPLRVTQALVPNLRLGERKLIVNMSSHLGSIAHSTGGWYAYRSSKTALNQINKILSVELGKEGITAVVLHPGWVRTELGGMNATYGADESVRGLINVIEGLDADDNGRFYDFQGKPIDW